MKRKITILLTIFLLLLTQNVSAVAIQIKLNGEYIKSDVEPFLENDRVFVPIRIVAENLDCIVNWDGVDRMVTIHRLKYKSNPLSVTQFFGMRIGEKKIIEVKDNLASLLMSQSTKTIDEQTFATFTVTKEIDVAPKIVNDRTFVPIRFVTEQFGLNVDWDNENKTVIINN